MRAVRHRHSEPLMHPQAGSHGTNWTMPRMHRLDAEQLPPAGFPRRSLQSLRLSAALRRVACPGTLKDGTARPDVSHVPRSVHLTRREVDRPGRALSGRLSSKRARVIAPHELAAERAEICSEFQRRFMTNIPLNRWLRRPNVTGLRTFHA